jgi:hypothetical protein
MASPFKIGATSGGITSLDALGTPCPDPQPKFNLYRTMKRLGDLTVKGRGPQTIIWDFQLIDAEEIAQLETFKSDDPIYIQSRKRDNTLGIFEVLMNWPDPKQDGEHMPGFQGLRSGLVLEFIVISEVV